MLLRLFETYVIFSYTYKYNETLMLNTISLKSPLTDISLIYHFKMESLSIVYY